MEPVPELVNPEALHVPSKLYEVLIPGSSEPNLRDTVTAWGGLASGCRRHAESAVETLSDPGSTVQA